MLQLVDKFRLKDEREDLQTVLDILYKGVVFRGTNLWVLVFAIFIASLGLNVNSTAVIIGAMLISPLMAPIMGAGFSLAVNDLNLLRKSLQNFGIATISGLAASTLYFSLTPLNQAHSEILARTSPTIYDVLIAFFGGLAGILATASKLKGNVIPGVAIATALMPPLCTAGYGLATWKMEYFFGASYLYMINSVFISLAALLTARLLRYRYITIPDRKMAQRTQRIVMALTLVTLLPSIYLGYDIVMKNKFTVLANQFIDRETNIPNDFLLTRSVDADQKLISLTFAGRNMSDEQIESLRKKLNMFYLPDARLQVRLGFSNAVEESKFDVLTEGLKVAIQEKEAEITRLQKDAEKLQHTAKLSASVYKEMKALYPDIQAMSAEPVLQVSDSTQREVYLCVVHTADIPRKSDQDRMREWLRTRLNTENVQLVFSAP